MKTYRFWVEIINEDGSYNGSASFEAQVQAYDYYTAQRQAQGLYPRARISYRGES